MVRRIKGRDRWHGSAHRNENNALVLSGGTECIWNVKKRGSGPSGSFEVEVIGPLQSVESVAAFEPFEAPLLSSQQAKLIRDWESRLNAAISRHNGRDLTIGWDRLATGHIGIVGRFMAPLVDASNFVGDWIGESRVVGL